MQQANIYDYYPFVMGSAPKPVTIINGKPTLYFGGVGYYQLHSHPEVIKAANDATERYGMGSATSRSYTGMTQLHFDVECMAARYFGTEDAAYLPSGYLSNVAGIQALRVMNLFDKVYIDEIAHYCNMDGANSVRTPAFIFKNNDPAHLLSLMKDTLKASERPLIVTDGLFSVYGNLACIPELLSLAEQYDGIVWIDDAHLAGVAGDNGRGAYEYFNVKSPRLFMGTTLSKAFGGFGGIIPGTKEFIKTVRAGNVLKGASQPPASAAAASLKGIEILMANPDMRQQLWRNARRLKAGLNAIGLKVDENYFPMAAFTTNDPENMKRIHKGLLDRNIFIQFSTYVGADLAGTLRMVVFSTHTNEQIDSLIHSLKELV